MCSAVPVVLVSKGPEKPLPSRVIQAPASKHRETYGVPFFENTIDKDLPHCTGAALNEVIELAPKKITTLKGRNFQKGSLSRRVAQRRNCLDTSLHSEK